MFHTLNEIKETSLNTHIIFRITGGGGGLIKDFFYISYLFQSNDTFSSYYLLFLKDTSKISYALLKKCMSLDLNL
jgi:hypothetical protein